MRGLLIWNAGTVAGREPVAMTTLSKERVCSPPATSATLSVFELMNSARPRRYVTLRCFASWPSAASEFLHHAVFEAAQTVEIDLRLAVVDAPRLGVIGLVHQSSHVQQGLRRNAADVEADAAGVLALIDQSHLHAEIGGKKCGGVSTGTAANHCNDFCSRR